MPLTIFSPLDAQINFPDPQSAETDPNGLLALGGNLSPQTLISAYSRGIFPWYDTDSPIMWWSPDPREVLMPGDQHWSRSMRKFKRDTKLRISTDLAFDEVIQACSRSDEESAWITEEMQQAYIELHKQGFAHSLEVWQEDQLVGGLYGVALGSLFCGESMFSRASNSSKLAYLSLAEHLFNCGFSLIDCQFETDHLRSLGSKSIGRTEYLAHLDTALRTNPKWPSAFDFNLG